MTKLTPMPGFVLISPILDETVGDFTIIETNLEKQQKGVVVAVGSELVNEWGTRMTTDVKPGDIVFHRSWGHESISIDGKEYRVARFLDICLKVQTND